MTVQELIDELYQFDEDLEVKVQTHFGQYSVESAEQDEGLEDSDIILLSLTRMSNDLK